VPRLAWLPSPLLLLAALLLLAPLTGCRRAEAPPPADRPPPPPLPPEPLGSAQEAVGQLAGRLLAELAEARSGDFVFSPAAALLAPAVLSEGAAPDESTRLRRAVGLGHLDAAAYRDQTTGLAELIEKSGRRVSVKLGLSVWLRRDAVTRPEFRRTVGGEFKALVTEVDFAGRSAQAGIDHWLNDATGHELGLLPEPVEAGSSVVALAAATLRAPWYEPFDPARTEVARFTRADGSDRQVRLMRQHTVARLSTAEDGLRRLDLPLAQGDLTFTLLLPADPGGLGEVVAHLRADPSLAWLPPGAFCPAEVGLPRLLLADAVRLDTRLGLVGQRLSRLAEQPLTLSALWQAAPLRLTEAGLSQAEKGEPLPPPANPLAQTPKATVLAVHPFVFLVRQSAGDLPLLVGMVR